MASGTIQKYTDGNDSGWKTVPKSSEMSSTGYIYLRKIGNIVYLYIRGVKFSTNVTDSNAHTIGTLESGYRPTHSNIDGWAGYDTVTPGIVTVKSSGLINFVKPADVATWSYTIYGSVVFQTD